MRRTPIVVIVVLAITTTMTSWKGFALAQEPNVEKLIAESNPVIQEQIKKAINAFLSGPRTELKSNCEGFQELNILKDLTDDKGEIVKQLAIFAVTEKYEEDEQVLRARLILDLLDLPSSIPIRVLAPHLDTANPQLRLFVRSWFQYHDKLGHRRLHPDFYNEYQNYVHSSILKNEEIPAAFAEYIFDRQPGRALLVFYYANWKVREKRSEIVWGEHVVSNAMWLKENEFEEQFQKALPEAADELAKLAKHDAWWVRLYVVSIMRRHRELRAPAIVQQLAADSNALVSKAAKSVKQ